MLEPTSNITLHKWYIRLNFPEIGYCAVYFQYWEVTLKNAARMLMKKYSKDLSTWANKVGNKKALENPHSLIWYVTFTDHLEIPQGLQFVRIQRSRKITPFIIWLSLFSPRVIYKLNKFPLQKGTVKDYERHPFLVTIEKEKSYTSAIAAIVSDWKNFVSWKV